MSMKDSADQENLLNAIYASGASREERDRLREERDHYREERMRLIARVAELEAACRDVHRAWMSFEQVSPMLEEMANAMNRLEHVLVFGSTPTGGVGGSG